MSALASCDAGLLRGPVASHAQPDMAMAGGTDAAGWPEALQSVQDGVAQWV